MAATQDPTPQEILERCAEIQRGWSPRERMSRMRVDLRPTRRLCDGRMHEIDANDYDAHIERHGATVESE